MRYFVLNSLKDLELIDEQCFKVYGTMIIKMYEFNYYEEYEDILEDVEENALVEIIELLIRLIDSVDDEELGINSDTESLIKCITAICLEKDYSELADSLGELIGMLD